MKKIGKLFVLSILLQTIYPFLLAKDIKENKFIFKQQTDKIKAYVGEPINITYIFKIKLDTKIAEANFHSPSFHDFWAKPLGKKATSIEEGYQIYKIKYLIFAQKSGTLTVESARMDIALLHNKSKKNFNFTNAKWKTLFSNPIKLEITPLPNNVSIYGNYKLDIHVDKTKTKSNKPVNLTIHIKGIGNIDDIEPFDIKVDKAVVYSDKPIRKIFTNNKEELGEFIQKFAIVSDENFTIEPIKLTFFDSKTDHVKTLMSQQFDIEVTDSKPTAKKIITEKQKKEIQNKKIVNTSTNKNIPKIIYLLVGFLTGFLSLITLQKIFYKKRTKDENLYEPIQKKIKKSKNDKELLSVLIPYMDKSDKIREIIHKLEQNIYKKHEHKINKKDLAINFEKYIKNDTNKLDILK